jgi:hypothetical protein
MGNSHNLAKRLDRLERLLVELTSEPPVYRWLDEGESPGQKLQDLIAQGNVSPDAKVIFLRWLTAEEDNDMILKHAHWRQEAETLERAAAGLPIEDVAEAPVLDSDARYFEGAEPSSEPLHPLPLEDHTWRDPPSPNERPETGPQQLP